MAPAALALGRERVLREAQAYAQAAVIDPVSGLFNRRYFQARFEEELHRAIRQLTSVGLLMVDLDGFKSINDRFGHVAGDMVIRDISEILRRSVRIFDVHAVRRRRVRGHDARRDRRERRRDRRTDPTTS